MALLMCCVTYPDGVLELLCLVPQTLEIIHHVTLIGWAGVRKCYSSIDSQPLSSLIVTL